MTKNIKISGTLTSPLQLKNTGPEPYYYLFVRLKGQLIDLPIIFKRKDDQGNSCKPEIKKSDELQLTGYYSFSEKSVRKSFTCLAYQLLDKKIKKECFGCGNRFSCLSSQNYDYCSSCEINGSRYLNQDSPCSECDGSGIIQFPNQLPQACKICSLAQQEQRKEENIFPQ